PGRERRSARAAAGSRCRTSARSGRRIRRPSGSGGSSRLLPLTCNYSVAQYLQPKGCAKEAIVEVTREVVVEAPLEEVWEALTDPEQLEEWFTDDGEEGAPVVETGEPRRRAA